jgi:hypothetical protein
MWIFLAFEDFNQRRETAAITGTTTKQTRYRNAIKKLS